MCVGLNYSDHAAEPGMGLTPPSYLKADDRVHLGVEGLSEQNQLCGDED